MDPDSSQIFILIILLSLSAYFSMAETAIMSINKIRLRNMVDEGVKNADLIQKIVEEPNKLLSSILIGNNLVNIGASSIATSIAINKFGSAGVGLATGLLTFFILIFGEITPKTYASAYSEKVCVFVIKPIVFCVMLLKPIVFILNIITTFFLRILGVKDNKKAPIVTESDLLTMVNVSHEEGVLEIDEREMINNVVDFGNLSAKDIMVPRTDMVAISINTTYDELFEFFRDERLSRLPVYDESMDDIVGLVSLKDFLFADNKSFSLKELMREPFFTYEFKPIRELFAQMRTKRMPMAIILDEYGGTSGIVTLEDMLEEIVGDISDEYDETEDEITIIKEDEFIVEGGTKIDDVNEMLGTKFISDDFDSIGGFVIGILGRFPEENETIELEDIKFIIEELDKNRIEKLRIIINN